MKKRFNYLFIFLSILLVLPAIVGLLHPGFFLTDDGNWMVIRFSAFYEALRAGQFPVRFLFRLNNMYGYPVSDFLYPLFMYIGVLIHIVGFNFVSTIKVVSVLSLVFSSLFSFYWLRKTFSNLSSLIGSLAYVYFPYHMFDLYRRGSIGEVLALAIVPFVFWQIERKNLPLVSFGIALLILSHNTLALIFLPVIFIYMILKRISFFKSIISLVISLGLSAFFWFPALYDLQFTAFSKVSVSDFSKYFVDPNNLNYFGYVSLIVLILSVVLLFLKRSKSFIYFFLIFIVFSFLALSSSKLIWQILPIAKEIQFPFRFLSVVCLAAGYLVCYQIDCFKKYWKFLLAAVYIILIFVSAKDFIYPTSFQYYPDSFYSTNLDTTTVKQEYMPKWVKNVPVSVPSEKVEVISGKGEISDLVNKGNLSFSVKAAQKSTILINSVYFPGWIVNVDGSSVPISYEQSGLIQFSVVSGTHSVMIYFAETPLRLAADLISLIFLIFLVCLVVLEITPRTIIYT